MHLLPIIIKCPQSLNYCKRKRIIAKNSIAFILLIKIVKYRVKHDKK